MASSVRRSMFLSKFLQEFDFRFYIAPVPVTSVNFFSLVKKKLSQINLSVFLALFPPQPKRDETLWGFFTFINLCRAKRPY